MTAWLLAHPTTRKVLIGAGTGAISALAVDYHAFRSWKTWHDVATYEWGIASFRTVQGAGVGALTGFGIALA
jgi:hypothetical protein